MRTSFWEAARSNEERGNGATTVGVFRKSGEVGAGEDIDDGFPRVRDQIRPEVSQIFQQRQDCESIAGGQERRLLNVHPRSCFKTSIRARFHWVYVRF